MAYIYPLIYGTPCLSRGIWDLICHIAEVGNDHIKYTLYSISLFGDFWYYNITFWGCDIKIGPFSVYHIIFENGLQKFLKSKNYNFTTKQYNQHEFFLWKNFPFWSVLLTNLSIWTFLSWKSVESKIGEMIYITFWKWYLHDSISLFGPWYWYDIISKKNWYCRSLHIAYSKK
jgi:hypothetical protein